MLQYEFPKGLCSVLMEEVRSQINHATNQQEIASLRKTLSILRNIRPHADSQNLLECGKIMRENIEEREDLQRKLNACFDRDRLLMRIVGSPLV